MLLHRLCRAAFSALDGEGARLYGGRWSSPGLPVVYTSSSLSLAALEYLVHLDPSDAPADLVALTIEVPDSIQVATVDQGRLDRDWASSPGCASCQRVGDEWLKTSATPLLRVPSALVPEEYNCLLNPRHPEASSANVIARRPFTFDPRMLR